MLALCRCERCKRSVPLTAISNTVPTDSLHQTVMYQCPFCGVKSRKVLRNELLAKLVEQYKFRQSEIEQLVAVFAFDLDGVETLEDLFVYWQIPGPAEG